MSDYGDYSKPAGRAGWTRMQDGGSELTESGMLSPGPELSGSIWPAELNVHSNRDGTWSWSIHAAHGGEFAHEVNTGGYERRCPSEEDAQFEVECRLWSIVSSMHAALADRGLGAP